MTFKNQISIFLFENTKFSTITDFLFLELFNVTLFYQCLALLRSRRKIVIQSLANSLVPFFQISGFFISMYYYKNLTVAIGYFTLIHSLLTVILVIYIFWGVVKIGIPDFRNLGMYLKFGITLIPGVIGFWIVDVSDRYLIKIFYDISSVGIYSVSYGIATVMLIFVSPILNILFPDFSELFDSKNINEINYRLKNITNWLLRFFVPAITGTILLSENILSLIANDKFIYGKYVLIISTISMGIFGFFQIYSQLLSVSKKNKILSIIWVLMAILNFGWNFILIPKYGINGAAISTCITFVFGIIVSTTYLRKRTYFNIYFDLQEIIKIGVATTIMSLFTLYCPKDSIVLIILNIVLSAAIYFAVLTGISGLKKCLET